MPSVERYLHRRATTRHPESSDYDSGLSLFGDRHVVAHSSRRDQLGAVFWLCAALSARITRIWRAVYISLRFLENHQHVVILGPVGVGKTFVGTALAHIACKHGYNARFIRADEMLRTLRASRLDNSRDAELVALTTVDLLVLDDFALEPMNKEESKDVYQLFLERTGRASMIVTSNRDTAEWISMFDDVLLAQSAVDRFKNSAFDFVMEGESYRPKLKPTLSLDGPPPPAPSQKPQRHPRSRRRH